MIALVSTLGKQNGEGESTVQRQRSEIRPNRQKQLDLFKEAYGKENNEIELYSRLHKISKYQRFILRILGLLTVIKLKNELFLRPNGTAAPTSSRSGRDCAGTAAFTSGAGHT